MTSHWGCATVAQGWRYNYGTVFQDGIVSSILSPRTVLHCPYSLDPTVSRSAPVHPKTMPRRKYFVQLQNIGDPWDVGLPYLTLPYLPVNGFNGIDATAAVQSHRAAAHIQQIDELMLSQDRKHSELVRWASGISRIVCLSHGKSLTHHET